MKHPIFLTAVILTLPLSAHAQGLQNLLNNTVTLIDDTIIPFLFGIAFLFFAVNVVRFFVFQGASEDGRDNARNLITYSVLAFVFLVIFSGVINFFAATLGLEGEYQPQSDYVDLHNGGTNTPSDCTPGQVGAC